MIRSMCVERTWRYCSRSWYSLSKLRNFVVDEPPDDSHSLTRCRELLCFYRLSGIALSRMTRATLRASLIAKKLKQQSMKTMNFVKATEFHANGNPAESLMSPKFVPM